MKKMILLFSHKLTNNQIEDAQENLDCHEFIALPEALQTIWSNVNPDGSDDNNIEEIKAFVSKTANTEDYILIQGEYGFTYNMVNYSKELGLIPVYATTERTSKEKIIDGQVRKTLYFKHVKFKSY